MAQHGYLHDSYDNDDFGREDDRERGWRDRHRDWGERDRGSEQGMFGWRDEDRSRGRDDDRGFFDRARNEMRSWTNDDDNRWESRRDHRERLGENRGFAGSSFGERGRHSPHRDDHYRNWRDKQIEALDRDYEDYCREREQQFHQDFDSWRQNRQQRQGSSSAEDVMTLDNPATSASGDIPGATTSPMGAATLGTNNSENTASAPSATGRGKR